MSLDREGLVYSTGDQLWRQPLTGDPPEELGVTLEVTPVVAPRLLIRRVRLLDFTTGGFGPETEVLVEQGRIRRIGTATLGGGPEPELELDAEGRFAIPGLFEMHGHVQRAFSGAWLAYGVTSLRDVGGSLGWVTALADRAEAFGAPLPRLFFAGDILHGVSTTRDPVMLSDGAEARLAVRRFKDRGVHILKTHPGLTWESQQALVDEAHELGLHVVEHGTPLSYLLQSVTVGASSVEHTYGGFRYHDDVLQLLAATGTRWTPTLAVSTAPSVAVIEDPEHWIDDRLRMFVSPRELEEMLAWGMDDDPRVLGGFFRSVLNEIRAARARGVSYLVGTDAPAWMVVPGASLHQELAAFAEAAFTPLEILAMATRDAAAELGADDWLGTVEVDKAADLVILDADPLEDIRNTREVWRVVKGGSLVDPADLSRARAE